MNQFVQYLDSHNLFASSQSAYGQFDSIETTLTRGYNDILMDRDKQGGEVIIVLRDMSAAFDTIDHTVAINRLKSCYWVGGTALTWFSSYLQNSLKNVYTMCINVISILFHSSKMNVSVFVWQKELRTVGPAMWNSLDKKNTKLKKFKAFLKSCSNPAYKPKQNAKYKILVAFGMIP